MNTYEIQDDGTLREVADPPTRADLVPVVRCRDCKHCRRDDSRWHCSELMFGIDWVTSDTAPDSFCAWGERK